MHKKSFWKNSKKKIMLFCFNSLTRRGQEVKKVLSIKWQEMINILYIPKSKYKKVYHYNLRYDLPFIHCQFFLLSGFEAEAYIVCESSLCCKQSTCKVHNLMIVVQTHYWTIFLIKFQRWLKTLCCKLVRNLDILIWSAIV